MNYSRQRSRGGGCSSIQFVLMRFCNSYVIYAPTPTFALEELQAYFKGKRIRCISGVKEIIDYVAPVFGSKRSYTETKLLKFTREDCQLLHSSCDEWEENDIKELSKERIQDIQNFYLQIKEFEEKFRGKMGIQKIREQFSNGKFIGVYRDSKLVFVFAFSSETEEFAMLDNIATLAEYRGQGIAYRAIRAACAKEINQNKKELLCWPCEGRVAERVAKKIGFHEVCMYSFFYPD